MFDIEAMLGLFELGIAYQKPATLDWNEQLAVMKEIKSFVKKQKKSEEIIRCVSEFIDAIKAGDNKKAYSKMFMTEVCIQEYNLIGAIE